ncbi:hypothetical protein MKW92_049031 [Papaver armeniacum]|nr:hypothetical protein MKW92_049031 [Papaver armeniacum]
MTAFDDSLIASALQYDHVGDRGVYSIPNITGGVQFLLWMGINFRNYMDKCSEGQTYLTIRSLQALASVAQADWKSNNPPSHLNHREVRFWVSLNTGKYSTELGGKNKFKRALGVAECRFDGSNLDQLFAFGFHYHKAFCCCGIFNN